MIKVTRYVINVLFVLYIVLVAPIESHSQYTALTTLIEHLPNLDRTAIDIYILFVVNDKLTFTWLQRLTLCHVHVALFCYEFAMMQEACNVISDEVIVIDFL